MRVNNISFTGYDARKLDGFVMTSNYGNIVEEMTRIGQQEGFNVYFVNYNNSDTFEIRKNQKIKEENYPPLDYPQDAMGIHKNKLLTAFEDERITDAVKHHFSLIRDRKEVQACKKFPIHEVKTKLSELMNLPTQTINGEKVYFYTDANTKKTIPMGEDEFITKFATNKNALETMLDKTHIRGGNYFITKNKSGEDELIIGADELKKFDKDQIKHMFSVQTVRVIPQMDKDLDLFIRPLNNGRILIADDNKKKLMENLCIAYRHILCKHELYATATTGRLVSEAANLNVHKYLAGQLGGSEQLGAQIINNDLDVMIFLRDPASHQSYEEYSNLFRLCDTHNIPVATNLATAEVLLLALDRGDLDWRNVVR